MDGENNLMGRMGAMSLLQKSCPESDVSQTNACLNLPMGLTDYN